MPSVGVVPDLSSALTIPKKGVVPSVTPPAPTKGQLWPRPAKNTGSAG